MIIDGHAHAARNFADITKMLKELDKNDVDKVLLCPSLKNKTDLSDPPKIFLGKKERGVKKLYASNKFIRLTFKFLPQNGDSNEFVYSLRQQAPDRILQFYWVDMTKAELKKTLFDSFDKYQYKGIKIHQAWTPVTFKSSSFDTVLEFAEANSLPIFIHPYSEKETRLLKEITLSHPKIVFIIAHLMGLHIFSDYKGNNIYHDISPHDLSSSEIDLVLERYSSKKIIFGSDTPFGNLYKNIQKIKKIDISKEEIEDILGGNISQILNLSAK